MVSGHLKTRVQFPQKGVQTEKSNVLRSKNKTGPCRTPVVYRLYYRTRRSSPLWKAQNCRVRLGFLLEMTPQSLPISWCSMLTTALQGACFMAPGLSTLVVWTTWLEPSQLPTAARRLWPRLGCDTSCASCSDTFRQPRSTEVAALVLRIGQQGRSGDFGQGIDHRAWQSWLAPQFFGRGPPSWFGPHDSHD